MNKDLTIDANGVKLLNLNWGYQIIKGNEVLVAVRDTLLGPRRTQVCTESAEFHYRRMCRLYDRLYQHTPAPSERMLGVLADIIKQRDAFAPYFGSIKALARRGVVRRKLNSRTGSSYFPNWEPNFPEAS